MDPYLEGSLWMGVHTQLLAEIARQLAPRLRPKYVAHTSERFVVTISEGSSLLRASLHPDVGVAEARFPGPMTGASRTVAAPLQVTTLMPEAIPHVTVEIFDAASRQLVTAIEVLSPTNKRPEGREEYLAKRARVLRSPAHLLEVDLLRDGARVPTLEPLPPAAYFVFLSRAEKRPVMDVWPVRLSDRLPAVPVPLLEGDPDVLLDLQQCFTNVYDLLAYDLVVDYTQAAPGTLSRDEAAWVEETLGRGTSAGQGRRDPMG
jgi:hypothetical protein